MHLGAHQIPKIMNISQRLRTCAKHTGLDAVIELLQEAADEIDALQARAILTQQPATGEPVVDVRCEGCGYMTHHREHMGCVRSAKQHTHPSPSVPATGGPVLTVEKEPDYWSGGHFHKGSKPHINPMKVWSLPIGTKLYTQPAPSVPDDVVRDAEWYRLIRDGSGWPAVFGAHDAPEPLRGDDLDAAMLAAK